MKIQEVFRTLMNGKPMMFVSRGKKSLDQQRFVIPSELLRSEDESPPKPPQPQQEYDAGDGEMIIDPVELQQQPRLGSVVWMLTQRQNAY